MSDANCVIAETLDQVRGEIVTELAAFPEGTLVEDVDDVATITLPSGELIREGQYVVEWHSGGSATSERTDLTSACQAEADTYPTVANVGTDWEIQIYDDHEEINWPTEPVPDA